jgi:hypothetical protein
MFIWEPKQDPTNIWEYEFKHCPKELFKYTHMCSFQSTLIKLQYLLKMYDMVPCSVIRSFHAFLSIYIFFFKIFYMHA